tara:strand:- start:1965 stop:2090 length:126 start_codon:yes stop_codon:yes gene_type:complete
VIPLKDHLCFGISKLELSEEVKFKEKKKESKNKNDIIVFID